MTAQLRPHGLVVTFEPGPELVVDLEGRLLRISEEGRTLRRSYAHRVLETVRGGEGGRQLARRVLGPEVADEAVERGRALISETLAQGIVPEGTLTPEVRDVLARVAAYDASRAREDAARYAAIYRPVAILPPDQYNALVLQVTEGCAHHECLFCDFYRGLRYRVKSAEELARHLDGVIAFHGAELGRRRGLFLEQANAIAVPERRLLELFDVITSRFELPAWDADVGPSWWRGHPRRFDGIYSFLDAFTGVKKSVRELEVLRRRNLRRVYVGMETGDEPLLRFLQKPATNADVLALVESLKTAGIAVGAIVLLGAGGDRYAAQHVEHTIEMLERFHLGKDDFVFLSPLVVEPGSRYARRAEAEGIRELGPTELEAQERAIRAALRESASAAPSPKIARYEIERFLY